MAKYIFLLLLLPLTFYGQQPPKKTDVKITPVQITKQPGTLVTGKEELYDIGISVIIYEGRNSLTASLNEASVVLLLATGLYATPSNNLLYNSSTPGPRKTGINFTGRLADTSISKVEVFYNALNNPAAEWDLVNIRIEGSARNRSTGQSFRWTINDLFPGFQILRPGTVAVTPERVPVRSMAWSSLPVRQLYPMLLIGNDDIKNGFKSLNFAFTVRSRQEAPFNRIIGGNYTMPQLPGKNRMFFTDKSMINNYLSGSFIMDNSLNEVMTSEVSNVGISYVYGDHGPFENDDFDLKGMCVNYYLTPTTGYRYYTNWNINARINGSGHWMMR